MNPVNPQKLDRHIRVCQSLIDRLAPDERNAWGDSPRAGEIPVLDFNALIAVVWTNLARLCPETDYVRVVWALTWLLDADAPYPAGRDHPASAHEPRSAPPASPSPPPQSPS